MNIRHIIDVGIVIRSREEINHAIRSVSPELPLAESGLTTIESYKTFNEDNPDFKPNDEGIIKGNGLILSSTTFEEARFLWNVEALFVPAEAQLRQFNRLYGSFTNIIACGPDIGNYIYVKELAKIAFRHRLVGLEPLMVPFSDLNAVLRQLSINSSVFVTLYGRVAYLFSFTYSTGILRPEPLFIRTIHRPFVLRLENCMKELMRSGLDYDRFVKTFGGVLTSEEKKNVEAMAERIINYEAWLTMSLSSKRNP